MLLKNHIGYRFLCDDTLALEIVQASYPAAFKKFKEWAKLPDDKCDLPEEEMVEIAKVQVLFYLVDRFNQKAYYITDSVLDKLSLLKVKKMGTGQYDWRVFSKLKPGKYTFILPPTEGWKGGGCLRVKVEEKDNVIEFCHLSFQFNKGDKNFGSAYWVLFFVDKESNIQCEHFQHNDVKNIEEFVYKILCFVFLSENTEEIIKPGEKKGTQKTGKIINSLPIPLIIVNSKWNITSIRTEGFNVSGHFAIRWAGEGRSYAKMVWIDPFEKHGYVRKAKNIEQ